VVESKKKKTREKGKGGEGREKRYLKLSLGLPESEYSKVGDLGPLGESSSSHRRFDKGKKRKEVWGRVMGKR